MPATHSTTFQRWYECHRCGFDYPISRLVRQNGVLVCKEMCMDIRDHLHEAQDEGGVFEEIRLLDAYEIW